jgi:hypothetical protein
VFGVVSGSLWVYLLVVWSVRYALLRRFRYRLWRAARSLLLLTLIAGVVSGQGGGWPQGGGSTEPAPGPG